MFKVRASRRDNGDYNLAYGKGGNKLEAVLIWDAANKVWHTTAAGQAKTKRDAVAAWTEWAVANYRGSGSAKPQADLSKPDGQASNDPSLVDGSADLSATAHSANSDDDELNENQRAFFDTLSKKRGELTEWQRAQARSMLQQIGWPGRKRGEFHASCGTNSCPPKYLPPQAGTADDIKAEHGTESDVSSGEGADQAA